MFTIIILDYDSGYIGCHFHTIAKSSLGSRVKGQAGTKHFSVLWYTINHNGHIKGELPHVIEWAQMEVGEATIVTGSYRWMKCELVYVYTNCYATLLGLSYDL